ncbi:hypothetical protein GCM10009854_17860 [Saccharopolyspora halophila]|uniref:Tc1-like transposase DDE domain-containing protein n=1 Tax=Saccharopolyspora halophila TaxID=405551 RepID=A0ABP5SYQ2_9PSEU
MLASMRGRSAADTAAMSAASPQHAREIIRAFNERGFPSLGRKLRGCRPAKFVPTTRAITCHTAKAPPQRLGLPFTTWSLSKPADYLGEAKQILISTEVVREILREAGVQWQATKPGKPAGTRNSPPRWPGPSISMIIHPGMVGCSVSTSSARLTCNPAQDTAGSPLGSPGGLRATFNRTGGIRHMFAALALPSGQMFYRFRDRKCWREFLGFCEQLRVRFPTGKLHLIWTNYGSHEKDQVQAWCRANGTEVVFTPTDASWLNWIECEFTALRYFPRRQRLPLPPGTTSRDRRLHPLDQPTRSPQTPLRPRLRVPQARLPTQHCLTKH